MNPSNGKGSVSMPTSSASWKTGDVVPDQFPAGLRVLVVDDDPTCLMILEKMLRTCLYDVTKCNRAEKALLLLRENKNGFDIVISDVHMPDMDGFKLLEHIGLEMDLPVIMMSADDGKSVVMKGVTHGACDYLIKPVRIEALKNIWQHVVRKKKNEWKDFEQSGSVEEVDRPQKQDEADYSSSANEGNWKNSKRRKDEDEDADERDDSSTLKKPRVVWSVELHQQFVAAVNQLGIDKAVPKKILELMNVPGLTRENVASHLQKYRLYLRRLSGVSQHPNSLNGSFMNAQEFGQLSSLNGLDFQTLAATGQLPAHSLATLQVAGLGRSNARSGVPLPLPDQRNNLFSFENPKLRLGEGAQQHMANNKQMGGLLHGIPTTMEPKQLANLHHGAQPMGSINMQVNSHGGQSSQNSSILMQMAQSQSRGQILNETGAGHLVRPMLTPGIGANISARNGIAENIKGTGFNPSPMLNFPMNHNNASEMSVNSFSLASSSGVVSKGSSFQQDVDSDIKGSAGFMPSYDIFNELHQIKSPNWELENVGMTFDASRHSNTAQTSLDLPHPQSGLLHQGFSSGQSGNVAAPGNTMFSANNGTQHGNVQNVNPNLNGLVMDNPIRVKTETFHEPNPATLFPEHFGQEDLMSALLKQQEGITPVDNDFEFDGYSIDNI